MIKDILIVKLPGRMELRRFPDLPMVCSAPSLLLAPQPASHVTVVRMLNELLYVTQAVN